MSTTKTRSSSATTWTKDRPTTEGPYWFLSTSDGPKTMAADQVAIVKVEATNNRHVYRFKYGGTGFLVNDVRGYFAGPIEQPSNWTTRRPGDVGWYWFTPDEGSPKAFERGVPFIVYVGCDENENIYGFKVGTESYLVKEVKGLFSGPIQEPSHD